MIPARFDYVRPQTLREATQLLQEAGYDGKILAGGHSLLPSMKLRLAQPGQLIDLSQLNELRAIRKEGKELIIGALTTHRDLETSPLVRRWCPLLGDAAASIGDVQVRNRGTLGGSLAHADPASDYPAVALVLQGSIKANSVGRGRRIPVARFFQGLFMTALAPNEIITEFRAPILSRTGTVYLKVRQPASGFAIVGVAALVRVRDGQFSEIRLAFNGVATCAYRADSLEKALLGRKVRGKHVAEACTAAAEGAELLDDIHASAAFRAHLARVYANRAIAAAVKAAS